MAQPFLERRAVQKGRREINVSVFQSAKGELPTASTLASVVEGIRTGRRAEQIKNLRTLLENEGKKAYDREKTNLAAFTMSATCSDRKTLLAHNGLIQADLDNLNGTLLAVRERMKSDPHVVAGFVSPSGKGLKIAFRVPANAERHRESFEAVACYVREKYDEKIDPACKDPLRLCFISSDPEAWLNEDAIELNVDAWQSPRSRSRHKTRSKDSSYCHREGFSFSNRHNGHLGFLHHLKHCSYEAGACASWSVATMDCSSSTSWVSKLSAAESRSMAK